ncbi:HAD family hydrolase [Planctomyces sp. SH-PL62]|uniref:HAD family hydrolase n=1 Tax=Planctomyces sp. SH-PL62 TaxID=1636152 RepID=UPI00078B550C|nr:HAD family hydrolase [Planctomyces sp. SH-PL62]AMV39128.1 Phosphoglycolate phosphatase [Planctomyces sp. SH-PL62]
MKLRAILFDLDGTLLDTLEDIGRSANLALQEGGFPPHPIDSYRRFIGDGVATLFRRALPPADASKPEVVARSVAGFARFYDHGWDVATQLYPGIAELLDALATRSIPRAILSNKPDVFTQKCVNRYLAPWRFAVALGQRDGVPRKPDPAGALEVADRLALRPEEILYLGDSSVDMLTANRAGMFAIGVAWGFREIEELKAHGAEEVVAAPVEVLSFLTSDT